MNFYDPDGIVISLGLLTLIALVVVVALRQRGSTQRAKAVLARDQDYRRLTEMVLTTQESTDQRLAEVAAQLADMTSRVASMEHTLKAVE
ncbi:hypothetical protein [Streptomyces sp. NPDC005435]|uniref:hypothetical protein n=1 Tax=Streptomyces sp. NPDC005435 TaxID=3154464 RepID=UPI003454E632